MLILINWLVWKSAVSRMTPKDEGTEAALALLATRNPFTVRTLLGLCWLVPVWPAILGIACWYFGIQKQKDPQAQPDMSEMQPGNPPGDSFARIGKGYETAD